VRAVALRRLLAVSALATLPVLGGCVMALGAQEHLSGDELPPWLPKLEPGAPRQQVLSQLGTPILAPPSLAPPSPEGDLLRWSEVLRPRECRTYILGIPLGREPRETRQIEAGFKDGRLVRADVTYLDRRGRVIGFESLLRSPSDPPDPVPAP